MPTPYPPGSVRSTLPGKKDEQEGGYVMGQRRWEARKGPDNAFASMSARFKEGEDPEGPGFMGQRSMLTKGGASAAFRSASPRFTVKKSQDKGENAMRSKSPSIFDVKKQSSGGAYKSMTPRFATKKIDVPGPGQYGIAKDVKKDIVRVHGASFTSLSSRFAEMVEEEGPPPGSYDVNDKPARAMGATWSKLRSPRFATTKPTTAAAPAYNVKRFGDGRPRPVTTPRGTVGFGSTSARF